MTAGREPRTDLLDRAIRASGIRPGRPHACPYLPGRQARNLVIRPVPLEAGVYHSLMDLNFRRSGPVFYRPECEGCRECRSIRVAVGRFRPSRAQRRCQARNRDLAVRVGAARPTAEKLALYRRYLEARHDGQMSGGNEEFENFLYASTVTTLELEYRLGRRLLAVGIADLEPSAMSAVYCYFDPDETARSLGVFNVLRLIDECRSRGRDWLYLGYYVREARRMSYKAGFRPFELLAPDGT